jgi:hypothetical protein
VLDASSWAQAPKADRPKTGGAAFHDEQRMNNFQPNLLVDAVVQVGTGRGFIVGGVDDQRYVITAAHCLPRALSIPASCQQQLSRAERILMAKDAAVVAAHHGTSVAMIAKNYSRYIIISDATEALMRATLLNFAVASASTDVVPLARLAS